MNSAALLADAGYSLSGKHALPITWPSPLEGGLHHSPLVGATPFGLENFEAVERCLVSILVIAGALGLIAVHSHEHMLDLNAEQYGGSHARCK